MRFVYPFLAATVLAGSPALAFPVTVENCGRAITFDKPPSHAVVHDLDMSEMAFALHRQGPAIPLDSAAPEP
jgi:iron complex transport system substrate-binding protein